MIEIIPMQFEHIDAVAKIEADSNIIAWSKKSLLDDFNKDYSIYFVAVENGVVFGYCGMYHIIDEGHITNIVVECEHRNMGIGSKFMQKLIEIAVSRKIVAITLEVRISNIIAQKLYTKFGFKIEGFRKNYYSDTHEDAIIMWKYF